MNSSFFERLLSTFKVEAEEHLKNISDGLILLENADSGSDNSEKLEVIYREAHSLKGAARAVSINEIQSICQNVENVFSALKKNEIRSSKGLYNLMHNSISVIETFLNSSAEERILIESNLDSISKLISEYLIDNTGLPLGGIGRPAIEINIDAPQVEVDIQSLKELKNSFLTKQQSDEVDSKSAPSKDKAKSPSTDVLKISFSKLDSLYHHSEETLVSKLRIAQLSDEFDDILLQFETWKKEWKKNLSKNFPANNSTSSNSVESVYILGAQNDFMDWNYDYISKIENRLLKFSKSSRRESRALQSTVDNMFDSIRSILIFPFSHLTDILPKMTREIAQELGKNIELVIEGAEIEIEKRILDEFKDPLIHLIRNCIDHGIETPTQRLEKRKPPRGTIRLTIKQTDASRVLVELTDDGAGIDIEAIRKSIIKKKFFTAAEVDKFEDEHIRQLIFRSGITTSPVITDLSGRGLGMAIVKEKIDKLSGTISINSKYGDGTKFSISLPIKIAAMRAITVSSGGFTFQIPTTHIIKVFRIKAEQLIMLEKKPFILFENKHIAVVKLNSILQLPSNSDIHNQHTFICILKIADDIAALSFDELLDENEIIIKPFNNQLKKIRNLTGGSIRADGSILPVLDSGDLIQSIKFISGSGDDEPRSQAAFAAETKTLLVADDSITSRMLMKDILESAGYKVKTAIDGVEALTLLKSGKFDLVVSDVEMPRMNGFELTSFIRKNTATAELPVVLVTGLAKREDKEKGIESGANAYVVKSNFDQNNLLEIIERLII